MQARCLRPSGDGTGNRRQYMHLWTDGPAYRVDSSIVIEGQEGRKCRRQNCGRRNMASDRKTRILTLVPAEGSIARIAPFLSRSQMEITHAETGREAIGLSAQRRFDLTIAALPLPDMSADDLVDGTRSLDEPGRFSPIVLLGEHGELKTARDIQTPSLHLVAHEEFDSVFRHVLSEALGVAARLDVRIPIRLEVGIEAGRTFRFCETRNISRSGLLISSSRPLPLKAEFRFELTFPYTLAPLTGLAVVVRQTDARVEGTTGFGARFVRLSEEDDVRIQSFIQNELSRH